MTEDLCLSSTELYDNYGSWFVPFWKTWWFLGIVVFLLCLSLVFIVRHLLRFRQRAAYAVPCDQALAHLQILFTREDAIDTLYVMLTDVLREYVHRQHQLNVVSVGDQDLEAMLMAVGRENVYRRQLSELLRRVDALKFSGEQGNKKQYAQDVEVVRQWILADSASGDTK